VNQPHERLDFIHVLPAWPAAARKALLHVIGIDAAISETNLWSAIGFHFFKPSLAD